MQLKLQKWIRMNKIYIERIIVPPVEPEADGNLTRLYDIEKACWIWHPEFKAGQEAILLFRNIFSINSSLETIIHVSADQRYELYLDGELISCGPDRCDLFHWSFASYKITFTPGKHIMEALVYWIGEHAPVAQVSIRGGFILSAEGAMEPLLTTGKSLWKVREICGWTFTKDQPPFFTGSSQSIDGRLYFCKKTKFFESVVIVPPLENSPGASIIRSSWRLYPSYLPDQMNKSCHPGRIRTVIKGDFSAKMPIETSAIRKKDIQQWQNLITGFSSLCIPSWTTVSVLWDLEEYYCGYFQIQLSKGKDAMVISRWTESLYEKPVTDNPNSFKGNRNEIEGKFFPDLIGDRFINDGGKNRKYRTYWWRSGRYILLTVKTQKEPLIIEEISICESRYPLENESKFITSSQRINRLLPFLFRGIQMCAHETYIDCPHYEQLMYVGDTRLQALVTYVTTHDSRLVERALELFNWSRWIWGIVAEHYPSRIPQLSATYAMIWILMLHDYVFWRGKDTFIKKQLPGMRGNIEMLLGFLNNDGLIEKLPGWSFIDWVPEWNGGMPPDGNKGVSSINNLFFLLALQNAAEIEEVYGDYFLMQRYRLLASNIGKCIFQKFWNNERKLVSDNIKHTSFSEHAQCLALLTGILPKNLASLCFESLITEPLLHRATIYFSFYLFETFKKFNRGDLIIERLKFWDGLLKNGLKTPLEAPEPSRSDCHGWGSHPLFHFYTSLAGIRPGKPGFSQIIIAPSPGNLRYIKVKMPHPKGWIKSTMKFDKHQMFCNAEIELPNDTSGFFQWKEKQLNLLPGKNIITTK